MTLEAKIEALLFWRAEPLAVKKLSKLLKAPEGEIHGALALLRATLKGRGVVLIEKDGEVVLGSAPGAAESIEGLRREELEKDLGKAGLETLSIILYLGPITRRDIDEIRGVNSAFIVRNLSVRGLIERIQNTKDQRQFLYRPTFELLFYLGISKVDDLPEFQSFKNERERITEPDSNNEANLNIPNANLT